MKKLVTVLLALAMAFTMVFATAASAEDGYKDSITWVIGNDQDILDPQKVFIDPENPPAGVVVQAKPSGDENQLEVQFIVNLD